MTARPWVVFIDDDSLVAGPLTTVLGPRLRERGFAVLDPVRTVDDVPAVPAGAGGPGVAVCDVHLRAGGPSGARAVRHLVRHGWRVLLVSGVAEPGQVLDAVAAGARGYLTRAATPDDRFAAILGVAEHGRHLSVELAGLLHAELRRVPDGGLGPADREVLKEFAAGEDAARIAAARGMTAGDLDGALDRVFAAVAARRRHPLTEREIDVIRAFGRGAAGAAEVARSLGMARHTVNDHLKSIRRKYVEAHADDDPRPNPRPQNAALLWANELGLFGDTV